MCFPLTVLALGAMASALTFNLATSIATPWSFKHLDRSFGLQTLLSSIMVYPLVIAMSFAVLPTRVSDEYEQI